MPPFLKVTSLTPPTGLASWTTTVVGPASLVEFEEPPVPMTTTRDDQDDDGQPEHDETLIARHENLRGIAR